MTKINQAKLLELTQKLISFKSISPSQNGAIDYIEELLKNLGFKTSRHDRGQTSNLIARIGQTEPIFAFAGHVDVVPPGDTQKWLADPFTLHEKDGHLYGRGISDMKGAVAGFIAAADKYSVENKLDNGSIMLLLTSDEESSAVDGTLVMVEYLKQNNIQIDHCILGEPTSVNVLGDVIKVGRRGSLTGHLEVFGKQGHIAYPDLCQNPIHLFAPALKELSETKFDNGNDFFPPTSLQFANLNSGLGVNNVIPGNLFASFNFRYNNLHLASELEKKVTDILDKHGLKFAIKWQHSAKPFYTTPGKLNQAVKSAISDNLGVTTAAKTDGGTSDGRFLIDVCNELLEFGLINNTIHQINENIKSADLFNLADTYYMILDKIFND